MAKIETIGTLTISAFATMSAAMNKSAYDNYDAISIFPPAGIPADSGSAVFLMATPETQSYVSASVSSSTPFAGAINVNNWFSVANDITGELVFVSSSVVTVLTSFPFENIALSTSIPPSSSLNYTVQGQLEVALTGLTALQQD